MPAPSPAISQQVAWKNREMRGFAVALVKAALALAGEDFTTDIVSDEDRLLLGSGVDGVSPGIAGSVITVLKEAHVIVPSGVTVGGVWYPDRRVSERPGAKFRYLNVYRLASRELAAAFLRKNDAAGEPPALVSKSSIENRQS